jgi:hypothetical protein
VRASYGRGSPRGRLWPLANRQQDFSHSIATSFQPSPFCSHFRGSIKYGNPCGPSAGVPIFNPKLVLHVDGPMRRLLTPLQSWQRRRRWQDSETTQLALARLIRSPSAGMGPPERGDDSRIRFQTAQPSGQQRNSSARRSMAAHSPGHPRGGSPPGGGAGPAGISRTQT